MKIPEVYKTENLVKIQKELEDIFTWYGPVGSEYSILKFDEVGRTHIQGLFERRKELLDSGFQMDEYYKNELETFNECLKRELLGMREKAMAMYHSLPESCRDWSSEIYVEARCYLDCNFPRLHPYQYEREQRLWAILTGALGYCSPYYKDGVLGYAYKYNGFDEGEDMLLYSGKEVCNWNIDLDPAMTDDMNLLYAFHNLYCINWFSIFDLLWVRDFTTKIELVIDGHGSNSVNAMDWFRDGRNHYAVWYTPTPIPSGEKK